MQKAKVGFQQDSVAGKIQKSGAILDQMEGNANFPKAQPLIAPMRATITALGDKARAAQASQAASRALFVEQGQLEADLDGELAGMVGDVNAEAGGDETKLLSSGFELAKEAELAAVPSLVTDFSLTRGDYPGTIDGHCHTVKGARAYESRIIVGAMPEGNWTSGATFFGSKFEWTGLKSGDTVWVEVRATGTAGAGPWSDAISIVVP